MKRIVFFVLGLSLLASPVFGDEVDNRLSQMTTDQVMESTRQMIRAGIPEDDAVEMTQRMIQNRFRNENTIRAQKVVMNTLNKDLPPEPVMNKAYEGMAKNVPDENIVKAMKKTRSRYEYAYRRAKEITPEKSRVRDIGNAMAEGITAGMTRADADRIMERLGERKTEPSRDRDQDRDRERDKTHFEDLALESFQAARTMARLGVSSSNTGDLICQALQQGYNAREMEQLQLAFKTQTRHTAPEQLARQYTRAIGEGTRAENLGKNSAGGQGQTGMSGGSGSGGSSGSSGGSGGGSGGSGSGGSGGGGKK